MKKLIALAIVAGFLGMAVGCGGEGNATTTKATVKEKGPGGETTKTTTAPK